MATAHRFRLFTFFTIVATVLGQHLGVPRFVLLGLLFLGILASARNMTVLWLEGRRERLPAFWWL